jgi:hypothetical protein
MVKDNLQDEKQYGDEFLSNHRRAKFFSKISTISPIIIFPLLSLYFQDWWLLFGILFSYMGGLLSIKSIWLIIIIVLTIVYSLISGFVLNSYINILFLCYLYGHITFSLGNYFLNKFENTKSDIENQGYKMLDNLRKGKSEK